MAAAPLSRRALLKHGGALVVTFAVLRSPSLAATRTSDQERRRRGRWLHRDRCQGAGHDQDPGRSSSAPVLLTAIAQIAAEELSVSLDRVTMIQGDTELTPNQGPTYASLTIQDGGMQIRRAAATAREALLDQAASRLKVREGHA